MSGQCYGCGAEFGFFKKEHGCKNCGSTFCSNCLTKKMAIPKLNGAKHHVCNRCYNVLTGKTSGEESGRRSPPKAFVKRVAALEQRGSQGAATGGGGGGGHRSGTDKPNPKFASLEKPDREIAQRLEKLREKPQEPKVTDTDINARLARLKGEDPAIRTAPTKPFYQPPDRRMQVEQIDDLLDEIANEVEIDSHRPDPAAYVEDRLARLRGEQPEAEKGDDQNNLDKTSPTSVKTYVKNIHVEANGNKKTAGAGGQAGSEGDVDFAEVQALMARAAVQMEADAQRALEDMKQDKELVERLAQVKQRHKHKEGLADDRSEESNIDNTQQGDDSEDEETAAQNIINQYLAEAKLDEAAEQAVASTSKSSEPSTSKSSEPSTSKSSEPSSSKNRQSTAKAAAEPSGGKASNVDGDDDYEDPDELPYCIICTEDATIRCIDCDMDLYCSRCFKDGHKELGLSDHRSVPYKAPKGYS